MASIYLVDYKLKTADGKRSSSFTRAYESSSEAFDQIQKIIDDANSHGHENVRFRYDLENAGMSTIKINGEGLFDFYNTENNDCEPLHGDLTLTLKEVYLYKKKKQTS